ncbi:MAG: response regulator transcription factor [Nitrospira sp.]|jgi:two-component system invasion response regulator UvrY|nr:response regulator transcription factor [Nitrospira sp.]
MNNFRCLITNDHPVVRRGVRELLEEEQLCSEIYEAKTGEEALTAVRRQSWDLMILDIALPDKHGLDVLKEAKLLQPRLPVLMLSLYPEKEFAMRAIKAGASGYLTKQSAPSELLAAVTRIVQGGRYITAALAEQMASALETGSTEVLHARLSDRELQVLRLLGQGKSVSVIAEELCLSVKTISTYRARILEKLSCTSTGELIRYAVEAKLID